MNTSKILAELYAERSRINRAIAALDGLSPDPRTTPGRRRRRGGMSAAGRKRISEMMKARWAARRKKAAKSTSGR